MARWERNTCPLSSSDVVMIRTSITIPLWPTRVWKQTTQFSAEEDWIFASPVKLGRLPYSYTGFWRELERASKEAEIGHLGAHPFRHTYRSWLDAVGTPIAVQRKLMRHSDIRTTMNIYGDAVNLTVIYSLMLLVILTMFCSMLAYPPPGRK